MVDVNEIEERLLNHGIKRTLFRIELLTLFIESGKSLSHQEVKEKITSTKDKVTIYRALETFLKKGLIHKVPDFNNVAKYALCTDGCTAEAHNHNHVHFICNTCKETYCLNAIKVPSIKNLEGFKVSNANLTLEGECPKCS